ncbi:ATP-binding protein [Amycolatopsis sp. H20-H5]|uniref:ATP-binding protein n=1 Tax=Amycolatopsis sp. H20-H5 TaxID=3046309 RepID=UPI002DBB430A|nr:NB-ARC domain-containing protein [Amycolatopsis sp. H20-H5]MEC3975337.1 NB-ARC domain-containing protein [Amycolatopsis sp. H20-H5]
MTPVPWQLPPAPAHFTGRLEQLSKLRAESARPGGHLVTISGQGGVGKTALALEAGHCLQTCYPDGQLYSDLRGAQGKPIESDEVLGHFLRGLGVRGQDIPRSEAEKSGLFRSLVAGRRLLLVLDNAADEPQVRPLLPGGTTCLVLVTSRSRLAGLDANERIVLGVLSAGEAVELFLKATRQREVGAAVTAAIVDCCDRLPLAVHIASARLVVRPDLAPSTLETMLRDERRRLSELSVGDLAIRSSFLLSYNAMPEAHSAAFRRLATLTTPDFPAWTIAAMLDDGTRRKPDLAAACRIAEELVDAHLLTKLTPDETGQERYRFHDLIRLFGRERSAIEDTPAEAGQAVRRALAGWLTLAERAGEALLAGPAATRPGNAPRWSLANRPGPGTRSGAQHWFDAERNALVSAVYQAIDIDDIELVWALTEAIGIFFQLCSLWNEWIATHQAALLAARKAGHSRATGYLHCSIGHYHAHRVDHRAAAEHYTAAIESTRDNGDRTIEAHARQGMSYLHRIRGQYGLSLREAEFAQHIFSAQGNGHGVALTELGIGIAKTQLGNPRAGCVHLTAATAMFVTAEDLRASAHSRLYFAGCLLELGEHERALAEANRALTALRLTPDRDGQAAGWGMLGRIALAEGRREDGLESLAHAVRMSTERKNELLEGELSVHLGEAYLASGHDSLAEKTLHRAAAIWQKLDLVHRTAAPAAVLPDARRS